jgi:3-oxoacyl-[acyl-carrier-protein] synthase III
MKKSDHEYVIKELGLSEEQSIYLENYGHMDKFVRYYPSSLP